MLKNRSPSSRLVVGSEAPVLYWPWKEANEVAADEADDDAEDFENEGTVRMCFGT